jgi:hypothetical protein
LLESYEVLARTFDPADARAKRAAGDLMRLYNKWSRPEQAALWRARSEGKP